MGYFDEQLRQRHLTDEFLFNGALDAMASAADGKHVASRFGGMSAENTILLYFGMQPTHGPAPEDAKDLQAEFERVFSPVGINWRKVRLDDRWDKDGISPMIAVRKDNGTPVALLPRKLFGYEFTDTDGKRVRVDRSSRKLFEEEAYCIYRPLPAKKLNSRELFSFMVSQLSAVDILLYLLLMAASSGLALIAPHITKLLFGTILASRDVQLLISISVFLVCYTLAKTFFAVYQSLFRTRLETKQMAAVDAAIIGRLAALPASFFKQYSTGDLTKRTSQLMSICRMLISNIGETGISLVFSIVYFVQIFSFAPALVLPSIVMTLISLAFSVVITMQQLRITGAKIAISYKLSGLTYAMINGIRKIKLAGAEKRMFARWGNLYARKSELEYSPPYLIRFSETIRLALTLTTVIVVYFTAIRHEVSVSDYYAFNAAYANVSAALASMVNMLFTISMLRPAMQGGNPIIQTEPEYAAGKQPISSLSGNIELQNVSFRYEKNQPPVLKDISLKIRQGESVAIVGETGCGKTTLINLLLGFEQPESGNIFYDQKNLSKLDLHSLRRRIGSVLQDSRLFADDIFSNIAITAPYATAEDVWNAAEMADIAEDIRKMPMGMNTFLPEGQGGISGGQRQRILIARALVSRPDILIFDEATSALDNISQKKISDTIAEMKCTRIIVAHRLSTIQMCDRIIVLHKGTIAEEGSYDELIGKNGLFAAFAKRQQVDVQ